MTAIEVHDPRAQAIALYRQPTDGGARLTQAEIAAQVGMSRSWVRDVIREQRLLGDRAGVEVEAELAPGLDVELAPATVDGPALAAPTVERPPLAPPVAATDTDGVSWWRSLTAWWRRSLDGLATLAVALVAAAASYGHMYHVALLAGESVWIARAWPITVDGLALVALRRGQAARRWLILSLLVSVAANVVAQYPDLAADAGPFIAGWPPLALYGCHHMTKRHHDAPTQET